MAERRTKEQIIADLEKTKAYHQDHINTINMKIEDIKNKKTASRKSTKSKIFDALKTSDKTPEEILAFISSKK